MDSKTLLVIGIGIGAYMLFSRQAALASGAQYRVPGQTATGAPRYPTAPTPQAAAEAAAYQGLGGLIAGIYRKIGGSQSPAASRPILPDDSIAANPPGNIDPYDFETATWGYGD